MQTTAQPAVSAGPQPGQLMPDFAVRTLDGRTIHRRDFKGRRHLVVCFAPPTPGNLLDTLAAQYADLRSERGELIVALAADAAPAGHPYPLVDGEGAAELRRRFGVTEPSELFVCDRYGEVVLRVAGTAEALPIDEMLPALQWMETRCSL